MVRIVRLPDIGRRLFSPNELSGHMEGIEFTPRELKARKKYRAQNNLRLPVNVEPAEAFQKGKKVTE